MARKAKQYPDSIMLIKHEWKKSITVGFIVSLFNFKKLSFGKKKIVLKTGAKSEPQ